MIAAVASAHVPVNLADAAKKSKGKQMRIRKNALKQIIAEATRLTEGWKNMDGSPWTPPPKSGRAATKGFDPNDIQANMGTSFMLGDESGEWGASGDLLDPADLRRLADTLEQLFAGEIEIHPEDMVRFDID